MMKDNCFFKRATIVLLLLAFTVLFFASCTKKNVDADSPETNVSATTAENEKSSTEKQDSQATENDEMSGITLSEEEKAMSKQSDESKTETSEKPEETTTKADYDTVNFQSDSSASVTVKNTVVNQCLKIKSVGESDGVLCVTVTNASDADIEYCVLKCKVGKEEAVFSFSVLPKEQSAVACEQNEMKYKENMDFSAWRVENKINFEQELSLYENIFDVHCENGSIEIKNKTENNIDATIKICYKNLQSKNLYTANAYLVSISGLKSGESKQIFPEYLDAENGRAIYIEYDK
ncbi:MAG: hypothetical protein ACI4W6_09105 [Acutalibacteraceae bacterium]